MSPFHRSFFFSSSSLFASSTSSLRLSLAFDSISHFLALIVSPSSSVHNDYSATTVASKPVVFPSLLVVVAAYFSAHAGSLTRQPLVPRDIYQHPRWRHNLAGFSSKVDESSNAASPFFFAHKHFHRSRFTDSALAARPAHPLSPFLFLSLHNSLVSSFLLGGL